MRVYTFGDGQPHPQASSDLLGCKAAGLVSLCALDLPVPPGFVVPTSLCDRWRPDDSGVEAAWPEVLAGLHTLEGLRGRTLGADRTPLVVAVRSGAPASMPGVLDTILNVGLTDAATAALGAEAGDLAFALDCQLRFIEMYAVTVLGARPTLLDGVRHDVLAELAIAHTRQAPAAVLEGLRAAYRRTLHDAGLGQVPDDAEAQLRGAIEGVVRSWHGPSARAHRAAHGIAAQPGTAVIVQAMVFGNLDAQSGTGVAVSRDPNTGEATLFGEFLPRAQGEAVVGGRHTPQPLRRARAGSNMAESLQAMLPEAYARLVALAATLEQAHGDLQDIEFTIERGTVWLLQARPAARSARAEVRVAVEMAAEGLLSSDEAVLRVDAGRINRLLHPSVDVQTGRTVVARGLPASPGAVSGSVVFDSAEAMRRAESGESVILVRRETSTDELDGIRASVGILTMRGGMTSHAALVARGLGKACVTSCTEIAVDERAGELYLRRTGQVLRTGDLLTLDGTSGEVMLGQVATRPAEPPAAYRQLMSWADQRRRLSVRGSADQPAEARAALEHGADGIGLCRTEHMFLDTDRVSLVREMVLAFDRPARLDVIQRILPVQRADFSSLFAVAGPRPVAIRLLDLPLHEVMPEVAGELSEVAQRLHVSTRSLFDRAQLLKARNPQMGHRGCRLGMTFPEVYDVQLEALFEAFAESGQQAQLQIVLPLVTAVDEVRHLRARIDAVAARVARVQGCAPFDYLVGAMLEAPRACLVAGALAEVADFFLFGTNDLTSAVFFVHRDDAGRFLPSYLEEGVLPHDPFARLDEAVVRLIQIAVEEGRRRKPRLLCGLSGAQAGDPHTVEICEALGLDFVSVAPHRVPVARLAAAQAAVKGDQNR